MMRNVNRSRIVSLTAVCILLSASGLVAINISDSYAVKWGDWDYTVVDSGTAVSIGFYSGSDTILTVPSEVNGLPVKRILGMYDNTLLESITLSENIEHISDNAFKGCTSLTTVNLNNGLNNIGSSAFRDCTSLTEIIFPDSLHTVRTDAFHNCSSLSHIDFGEGSLEWFDNNNSARMFKDCISLTTVTIPSNLDVVPNQCFEGCTALTDVIISEGVTKIGSNAFKGCTSLESIIIPDSVTSALYAFEDCTSLSSVHLGSGLQSIGNSAFKNCTALKTINIPAGIGTLGKDSFANSGLVDIMIFGNLNWPVPDQYPFTGCTDLTAIYLTEKYTNTNITNLTKNNNANLVWGYGIFFDSAGGSEMPPLHRVDGDSYGMLPTPTKLNHVFAGWYLDGEVIFPNDTPTESTTLTAQWLIGDIDYKEPKESNRPAVGLFWHHVVSGTSGVSIKIINTDTPWINVAGGNISGIPDQSGTYDVTLELTAPGYAPLTKTFTLDVKPQLTLLNTPASGAISYVLS